MKEHHPEIDTSYRRCKHPDCKDPTITSKNMKGSDCWYGNDEEGWECSRCYKKRLFREKTTSPPLLG